jgi:hypothetical protein
MSIEWTPKVGEECRCMGFFTLGSRVRVVCVCGNYTWVQDSGDANGGYLVRTDNLRPLPVKPPVAVGDYCVLRNKLGDLIAVGRVGDVKDNAFRLCLSDQWFLLDEYSITKLKEAT